MFRCLSRFLVYKKHVNTACVYGVNVAGDGIITGQEVKAGGGVYPVWTGTMVKTSGATTYPTYIYAGTPDGTSALPLRYFYFDVGDEVDIAYSWTTGTGLGFTLSFDKWTLDQGVQVAAAAATEVDFGAASGSGTATYIFSAAGYYTAKLAFYTVLAASTDVPDAFAFTIVSVNVTTTTAERWIHLHAPDLNLQVSSINGHRFIAGAAMYTNTSNPLNRGGGICSASLGPTLDWQDFSSFSTINSVQGAVFREAKNGVYGHLKPCGPEDFNLKTTFTTSGSNVVDSYYSLKPTSNWSAFSVNCTDTSGQLGVITYGCMYEYPTENRNLDARLPQDSSATMEMALNAFKSIDQFSDNPTHYLQALMGAKRGVGHLLRGIETYGPQVIKGARRVRRWIGE
jgi:hypothetical protein